MSHLTIDRILCRLATGYTRKELLESSGEDTGLDEFEVQDELEAVDRTKAQLASLIEQYFAEVIKVPECNCKHARYIIQEQRTKAAVMVEELRK